jgi:signal transduction histidine kinase
VVCFVLLVLWVVAPPLRACRRPRAGAEREARRSRLCGGAVRPAGPACGEADAVPDGVDLSAYRIVQEGLTNVLRHGGPRAKVTIGHRAGAVEIEISDDGRRPDQDFAASAAVADAGRGAGHGLIGMRERVSVFGGTLVAEDRPGGGFRLAATLPFAGPGAAGAVAAPALGGPQ